MRAKILGLTLTLLPYFAYGAVEFRNDREGETYYDSGSDKRDLARALKQVDQTQILRAFDEIALKAEPSKVCGLDMVIALSQKLKKANPKFDEVRGSILYLRSENEIDDVIAKQLMIANDIMTMPLIATPKDQLITPTKKEEVASALKIIAGFEKKSKGQCFDEAYKNFYNEVTKLNRDWKSRHVEGLLVLALEKKQITLKTYTMLERARTLELETSAITIKNYLKKIQSLRTQFPLRDPEEKSDFITMKADKIKMSYRMKLMENYTDIQIVLMSNIIKKLRKRIESPKAEILIFDRDNGVETIELEPMERFRLAVKLLRKEMALISLNTYFAGRTPDYMDLMTAAYEVGVIPAEELKEVAGLEEIWNPKKTFWEKADIWIRTFSTVATIALPPPYGFVPALVLVVIEMTVGKKEDNTPDNTVLF